MLQRFLSKFNEFNETSRGKRKGFAFEKSAEFISSELLLMVSSLKKIIHSLLNVWNNFQRVHIDVQAEESEFLNIGALCQFDQNEDTFSVYFDELEHYFTFFKMVSNSILEE